MTLIPRTVKVLVGVVAAVAVLGIVAAITCLPARVSFAIASAVYDNVPSKVGCSEAPPIEELDLVVERGTPFDLEGVQLIGPRELARCPGKAHLDIAYGGHEARVRLETKLEEIGAWDPCDGWSWRSIPVSLRNI